MQFVRFRTFTFVLLLLPGALSAQIVVEGRVELPKSKSKPVMNKRYEIVTKSGVISTNPPVAVVYLEGAFPKPGSLSVKQMNQKDFTFVPGLLPVQLGTKVEFPNQDDVYHNVFSFSPAKRFDLGRYLRDEKPIPFQIFEKAGMVTLRCDIHEHMRGLIIVLDTPYFTTTATDGTFKLTGLPEGVFKLKAWIDSRTTLERKVELKSGAPSRVNLP